MNQPEFSPVLQEETEWDVHLPSLKKHHNLRRQLNTILNTSLKPTSGRGPQTASGILGSRVPTLSS